MGEEALSDTDWSKVLVALHTGLDRGAHLGLRWADVDFRTRTIHAERRKGRRSGPVPVAVPINDDLFAVLRALPSRRRSAWLFPSDPNDDSAGPLGGEEFDRRVWRPALERAGLTRVRETRTTERVRAGRGWRTVEKVSPAKSSARSAGRIYDTPSPRVFA